MQKFGWTPRAFVDSLWRNRDLVKVLTQREVVGRYKGSSLGLMWSFFHPLFMLAVYTFVFSVIFQARWGQGSGNKGEFALVLFSGLIVFNFFAECVNRSPGLILSHPNYVKKVVFPLEILPWVIVGSALFHGLISAGVWLLFYILLFGVPHVTVLLFPLALLPLIFLTVGVTWFLTSLGVYVRDIAQVVTLMTTVLMFLSPIFYPVSALPPAIRPVLMLNPIAPALAHVRDVLMWGRVPNVGIWLVYLGGCLVVAWLGFAWFQKTRKGFADVI